MFSAVAAAIADRSRSTTTVEVSELLESGPKLDDFQSGDESGPSTGTSTTEKPKDPTTTTEAPATTQNSAGQSVSDGEEGEGNGGKGGKDSANEAKNTEQIGHLWYQQASSETTNRGSTTTEEPQSTSTAEEQASSGTTGGSTTTEEVQSTSREDDAQSTTIVNDVPLHPADWTTAAPGCSDCADKVVLVVIEMLFPLAFLGFDRIYVGCISTGMIKMLTLGGCGVWGIVDWFIVMVNALEESPDLNVGGIKASFHTKGNSIEIARILGMIDVAMVSAGSFLCLCGTLVCGGSALLRRTKSRADHREVSAPDEEYISGDDASENQPLDEDHEMGNLARSAVWEIHGDHGVQYTSSSPGIIEYS